MPNLAIFEKKYQFKKAEGKTAARETRGTPTRKVIAGARSGKRHLQRQVGDRRRKLDPFRTGTKCGGEGYPVVQEKTLGWLRNGGRRRKVGSVVGWKRGEKVVETGEIKGIGADGGVPHQ